MKKFGIVYLHRFLSIFRFSLRSHAGAWERENVCVPPEHLFIGVDVQNTQAKNIPIPYHKAETAIMAK